ncbi:MAG: hypothetical protein H7X99_02605 [Saprospiraceae bacterium]|nr:hypothetical protein [Saprospiraceae bacterium]
MRTVKVLLLSSFFYVHVVSSQESYMDFPFDGWSQTYTSSVWTGVQFVENTLTYSYSGDSTMNGKTYKMIGSGNKIPIRYDQGKIYQYVYTGSLTGYEDKLQIDFTIPMGSHYYSYFIQEKDSARVSKKEKILNGVGDSVWYIELLKPKFGGMYDTIKWMEGIGDISSGLNVYNGPEGGLLHSCTRDKSGRKLYYNKINDVYCNCEFVYGTDHDNDGYGNHIGVNRILNYEFVSTLHHKYYVAKQCDTITLISDSPINMYLSLEEKCDSLIFGPDQTAEIGGKFHYTLFGSHGHSKIYFSEQCVDLGYIEFNPCITNDCDDDNPEVYYGAIEIPNNATDEDCDGDLLIIDEDNDGYNSSADCDDNDPDIHPDQTEKTYNGIDDDCNPDTPDDDLDMDGFLLAEDCNDLNAGINPDVDEIPGNNTDDNCDGVIDEISSSTHLGSIKLNIFPNPVSGHLNIITPDELKLSLKLCDLTGRIMCHTSNTTFIDMTFYSDGLYMLEILNPETQDLCVKKIMVKH